MIKIRDMVAVKGCWRLFLSFFLLNGFSDVVATELVRKLPIQVKTDKDKKKIVEDIKNQQLNKLLFDENVVFVKTTDDKIIKLPLWQINQMPALFKELSQQKENSLLNPVDISQVNSGIGSNELQLLSDTWVSVKNNAALSFIKDLPKDRLLMLNAAAEKVGSGLLYATTSDFLLLPEIKHKIVEPLIDPLVKLLQKNGDVELQFKRSFLNISQKFRDKESIDRTKRVGVRGDQLLLYDIAHDFKPQEVSKISNLPSEMWYKFSDNGRIIIGIPSKEANSTIHCWDTYDHFKKYTIPYSGFIGHVVCSPDGKTVAFTGSDQKVKFDKLATRLYACDLTQDNPKPKQLTWVEGGIKSISFSPNGKQLVCFSKEKLLLYDSFDNFKAQEVISDNLRSIELVEFDPKGTKFIYLLENKLLPHAYQLRLYVLIGKNYIYKNSAVSEDNNVKIDFDTNGDACIIESYHQQERLRYWNRLSENSSQPQYIPYLYSSVRKSKLSPDGKICVFAGVNELCFFYTDNLQKYYYLIEEIEGNLTSIRFSPDSKKCFILLEYPDRQPGYDPESTVKIDELTFDFGFEDLHQCNIGGAEVLYNLYYRNLLKHTLENESPKNIKNIVKGTLSYELFTSLPVVLQEKMKFILGISVIDEPKVLQEEHAEIAAEEILPDKAVMAKLHYYLNQPTQRNIKHFQDMEKEIAAWKIDEIDDVPEAATQEKVVQDSKQSAGFWKPLFDFGGNMYRNVQALIQKWTRESKPIPEEIIKQSIPEKANQYQRK